MRRISGSVLVLFLVAGIVSAADGELRIVEGVIRLDASLSESSLECAWVLLRPESGPVVRVATGADGVFSCTLATGRTYRVEPLLVQLVGGWLDCGEFIRPTPDRIEVPEVGTIAVCLGLPRECELRVEVVRPGGLPVPGAEVSTVCLEPGPAAGEERVATTGPDGSVVILGLPPGRQSVRLEDPGIPVRSFTEHPYGSTSPTRDSEVSVFEGRPGDVRFDVDPVATLRVRVDRRDLPEDGRTVVSVRRRWPDGIWRPPGRNPGVNVTRVAGEDGAIDEHRFSDLTSGRYRIRVMAAARLSVWTEIEIEAGVESGVPMEVGDPGATIPVRYLGEIGPQRRHRNLHLTRWGGGDLDHMTFREGERQTTLSGLRPGKHLAILWDLELAMVADVGCAGGPELVIDPPKDLMRGGRAEVLVDVRRSNVPVGGFLVGIVPHHERRLDHGTWIRWVHAGARARFAGLPAGIYEVLVFDGLFGHKAAMGPTFLRRTVFVGEEAVTVRIDI